MQYLRCLKINKNMKQKFFELYWCWYEDYSFYLFYHENKTEKEFQSDVKKLMKKYGDTYLQEENSWAGASEWIRFVAPKMTELGYEEIKTVRFGLFGSYIIKEDDPSEDLVSLTKLVGKKLVDKAFAHNKVVRDDMHRRMEEKE